MMPDFHRRFPEWDCVDNGDPFIAELVKADDIISDYTDNIELLCELSGKTKAEADAIARDVQTARDQYEITTLERWLALELR